MAYTAIDDAGSFFKTLLYTGTGSSNTVTGVGFQPDFTWIKNRGSTDGQDWYDSVRGAGQRIRSNANVIESDQISTSLSAWVSDGFTVLTNNAVNASANNYVSWSLKAGTTSGIATNGSTTITPDAYSFNQTSGYSILKYEGTNSNDEKVAHGLGAVPECIIIKDLEDAYSWCVYHQGIDIAAPEDYVLRLDTSAGRVDNATMWNDTPPDSVNFTLGDNSDLNPASKDCIAYCFKSIKGYSRFGQYIGNGDADGPFVYTGFRPSMFIIKRLASADNFYLFDKDRLGFNIDNEQLYPDATTAEATIELLDICSNGFKLRNTEQAVNNTSEVYIYMAWAEAPLVNSSGVPVNAR